jgi:hypothetical protein
MSKKRLSMMGLSPLTRTASEKSKRRKSTSDAEITRESSQKFDIFEEPIPFEEIKSSKDFL